MIHRNSLSTLSSILLIPGTVALTGCWEVEQTITVNPDGTARVRVVREIPLEVAEMLALGGEIDGEDEARKQAAEIIEGAQGVDVWHGVEWGVEQNSLRFSGTAYVPDLGGFRLEDASSGDEWAIGDVNVRRDPTGMLVEYYLPEGDEEDPLPTLTEEEALELARSIQSELRQTRSVAAGMLMDARELVAFRLPSEPSETDGFTQREDGLYVASFEGAAFLEAMQEIADEDPELLAQRLREGAAEGKSEEAVMLTMLTERVDGLPAYLVLPRSGEPQFDYAAEVAAAVEAFPALAERLAGGAGGPDLP